MSIVCISHYRMSVFRWHHGGCLPPSDLNNRSGGHFPLLSETGTSTRSFPISITLLICWLHSRLARNQPEACNPFTFFDLPLLNWHVFARGFHLSVHIETKLLHDMIATNQNILYIHVETNFGPMRFRCEWGCRCRNWNKMTCDAKLYGHDRFYCLAHDICPVSHKWTYHTTLHICLVMIQLMINCNEFYSPKCLG